EPAADRIGLALPTPITEQVMQKGHTRSSLRDIKWLPPLKPMTASECGTVNGRTRGSRPRTAYHCKYAEHAPDHHLRSVFRWEITRRVSHLDWRRSECSGFVE